MPTIMPGSALHSEGRTGACAHGAFWWQVISAPVSKAINAMNKIKWGNVTMTRTKAL